MSPLVDAHPHAAPMTKTACGPSNARAEKARTLLGKAEHAFQYEDVYNSALRKRGGIATDAPRSAIVDGARAAVN